MRTAASWVCAALMVPAVVMAQPAKSADDWYTEGENHYNLGEFTKAVDAFKKGFEAETVESKKAAYLYNIAQSYRQAKECGNAQFFYKRYLALKDNDTKKPLRPEKRTEIEELIKELDDCAKQQEALTKKPPDSNLKPGGETNTQTGPGTTPVNPQVAGGEGEEGEDEDGGEVTTAAEVSGPSVLSARVTGGASKIMTGDSDLLVPVQATFALIGGYPLALNEQLTLELGAAFSLTPVPFTDAMGGSQSAMLIGALANAGATFAVTPKISLRGDLGLGVLAFSGVSESPFTEFAAATGALTMFHLRVGASVDFAFTPNLVATVAPLAFSYSPAKTGLKEGISALTSLDFMVGLGYRM